MTTCEHTTKCNTETRRNKEQVKHGVPPNPKEKQGTSLVESPIMLRRETSYGLGVPQQTALTLEINLSQYARETKHLTLRDIELYLVPDGSLEEISI